MTGSARNCPRQLPSSALDRATRLLPAFGSCYYLSTERVDVSQALRIFCRTLSSRFTGIRSTCHSPSTVRSSAPCARSKNGCRPPEYAIFIMLYHTHTRHRRDMVKVKRGKCSPYSTAERRFRSWSWLLAVSLQVTWVINPAAAITFHQTCSYPCNP